MSSFCEIAAKPKIDRAFVAMNKDEGWKISEFIPNAKQLDYDGGMMWHKQWTSEHKQLARKKNISLTNNLKLMILKKLKTKINRFDGLEELDETVSLLKNYLQNEPKQVVLCHREFL